MTPLAAELRGIIAAEGPLSVARYMALCLGHPIHGFYTGRDPLGAAGDFTTAPEISQMFGELLGLWVVAAWQAMGMPAPVRLVELGPGRGTLMADALRAARVVPSFLSAASVHLVETSPLLRARQRETLAGAVVRLASHDALADVPEGPLLVLANEFFDALPVHQAVRAMGGWHERAVGLDEQGRLAFALAPEPIPRFADELPPIVRKAPPGAVFEWREEAVSAELCRRVAAFGGAALVIDYGHAQSATGDTLQAVRRHAFADPLAEPGEADLTAHVDFTALAATARRAGLAVHGPLEQGRFLRALGLEARAAALKARATPAQGAAVDAAVRRLAGEGPGEMGALFKAVAFSRPDLGPLPGFVT